MNEDTKEILAAYTQLSNAIIQLKAEVSELKDEINKLKPFIFKQTLTKMEEMYLREAVREMIRDEVSSIESLEYKALSHINEQVIDKMRYIRLFFSIQKNKYKRYIIKEIRKRMR